MPRSRRSKKPEASSSVYYDLKLTAIHSLPFSRGGLFYLHIRHLTFCHGTSRIVLPLRDEKIDEMNSETFDEATALRQTAEMIETGSTFEEIAAYLSSKGMAQADIRKIVAQASMEPLQKQFKMRLYLAIAALVVAGALYSLALFQQQQEKDRIRQLVERGQTIQTPNGEYVLLNDSGRDRLPGRIAAFSAIFGLFSAFGAFRSWQGIKETKQLI